MTTKTDETLEAAITVLVKHGIRRTSMNDIADAAGVSRQTLYSQFGNKEGIVQAVILYATEKTVVDIEEQWQSCDTLAAKLDAYHQHAVVKTYLMLKAMPDAADLHSAEHPMVAEAFEASENCYMKLLRNMLKPSSAALKQHGETPTSIASFIVTSCHALKSSASSEADLKKRITTLRRMVLLMVG